MKPTNTLATTTTPDGKELVLKEHDGEYFLRLAGRTLMSTSAAYSEQVMAELACQELPQSSPRVLIGGLGFGFTLRKVLELVPASAEVVVAEIMPIVVEWNRTHLQGVNGALLDDPRTNLQQKDVFDLIKEAAGQRFQAILLDVDNSPDALVHRGNARLYSTKGQYRIHDALHPGGRVVFWSATRDTKFEKSLGQVFAKVEAVPAKSHAQARRPSHTLFVAQK